MSATGHGHGKLILCGEHAVVYGHPALAMAIDRGTTVRLIRRPGPTGPTDPSFDDPRLIPALLQVLPKDGLGVEIITTVPVGRGMGSSAALAVALVRAESSRRGHTPSLEEVFARAFNVERVFHGNASGLDHAVSSRGGLLRYRRGPPPSFEALPVPRWPVVVIDSGVAGDTREMVEGVAARRPGIDAALDAIGGLVGRAVEALDDPARLGSLLTENHRLLVDIGVSTPTLDEIVAVALDAGAWGAKLAGAGGGGVVIALAERPDEVVAAAIRRGFHAFVTHAAP